MITGVTDKFINFKKLMLSPGKEDEMDEGLIKKALIFYTQQKSLGNRINFRSIEIRVGE